MKNRIYGELDPGDNVSNEDLLKRIGKYRQAKKDKSVYICEEFMKDMEKYIRSKCPDVDDAAVMDIATYAANRMLVAANDIKWEYQRQVEHDFRRAVRKQNDNYQELHKKYMKKLRGDE